MDRDIHRAMMLAWLKTKELWGDVLLITICFHARPEIPHRQFLNSSSAERYEVVFHLWEKQACAAEKRSVYLTYSLPLISYRSVITPLIKAP